MGAKTAFHLILCAITHNRMYCSKLKTNVSAHLNHMDAEGMAIRLEVGLQTVVFGTSLWLLIDMVGILSAEA